VTKEEMTMLVETTDRSKSNTKRLDNLEPKVDDIHELTISVKELAMQIKAMREDINKIDNRVLAIESKPIKRWDSVVNTIITVIVSAIVGYALAKVGLGG